MSKTFTTEELLKISEKEKQAQKLMNDAAGRGGVFSVAQFKADTVNAMWQRIMARLTAEGGTK